MSNEDSASLGNILIIGGSGFLGHHIIEGLTTRHKAALISVLDVRDPEQPVPDIQYIKGDITSKLDVQAALEKAKPAVIFHTASPDPLGFNKNKSLFDRVNIEGTRNVLESAQESSHVKALVYTSSSHIIHDGYADIKFATEDARVIYWPEQRVYYAHTKAVAEGLVLAANNREKLLTTAIRPAGLFGEGDMTMTGNVCQNARDGRARVQIGDNRNLFDLTYVSNNVDAQVLAAKALLKSWKEAPQDDMRVDGEAFVITNDDPWPFWDFTRAIAAAGGYPVRKGQVRVLRPGLAWVIATIMEWVYWLFTFGGKEPALTRGKIKYMTIHRTFDISKARKRLGYQPRVGMQEGIDKAGTWWKTVGCNTSAARR